jgi:hypothetical protein
MNEKKQEPPHPLDQLAEGEVEAELQHWSKEQFNEEYEHQPWKPHFRMVRNAVLMAVHDQIVPAAKHGSQTTPTSPKADKGR